MKTWSLLFAFSCTVSALAADLVGTVQQKDGQPIPGAWVKISTARMRTGDSPVCPSCWMDCRKSAKTDASGNFRIADVGDQFVFRVLVVADDYAPTYEIKVDPAKGPAEVTLERRDVKSFPPDQRIEGRVVGPEGQPVSGVDVSVLYAQDFPVSGTLTDADGRFVLTSSHPVKKNALNLRPEGFLACRVPVKIHHGMAELVAVQLSRGTTISGQVLYEGKTLSGVRMGAIMSERGFDHDLPAVEAVSGRDGTFQIFNVPPHDKIAVYGLIDSLSGKGAIPVRVVQTGADDSNCQAGDFTVEKACRISGQFHLPEGKTFPTGTRTTISRDVAWDWQMIDVSPDGHFEANGFSLDEIVDVFAPDNPPDHHVQSVSSGFEVDPYNPRVKGATKEDTHLDIQMIWKDPKVQLAEGQQQGVREPYKDFLKTMTPEKQTVFVEAKLTEWGTTYNWKKGDKPDFQACKLEAKRVFEQKIKAELGEEVLGKYQAFEELQIGRGFLVGLLKFHKGEWLTLEEKEALIRSISRRLNEFYAHEGGRYYYDLSREEKLTNARAECDCLVSAGAEVLPPAKLVSLREWAETGRSRSEVQIQAEEEEK